MYMSTFSPPYRVRYATHKAYMYFPPVFAYYLSEVYTKLAVGTYMLR